MAAKIVSTFRMTFPLALLWEPAKCFASSWTKLLLPLLFVVFEEGVGDGEEEELERADAAAAAAVNAKIVWLLKAAGEAAFEDEDEDDDEDDEDVEEGDSGCETKPFTTPSLTKQLLLLYALYEVFRLVLYLLLWLLVLNIEPEWLVSWLLLKWLVELVDIELDTPVPAELTKALRVKKLLLLSIRTLRYYMFILHTFQHFL